MSAKTRFQELTQAYETLYDPEARNAYDALRYTTRIEASGASQPSEPISCSRCGKITAQPRSTVFTYVVSIIFVTFRNPIQGIFCSSCARKAALKASLISAVAGWWGFPWGPIYTIGSIIKNTMGGACSRPVNEGLQWFNTLAFLSQGRPAIAYALARQLSTSTTQEISAAAQQLIIYLQRNGVPANSPLLKDPWSRRPLDWLAHVMLLIAVPLIIFCIAQSDSSLQNSTHTNTVPVLPRETSRSSSTIAPPTSQPAPNSQSSTPAAAKCPLPVQNGEVLAALMPPSREGHVLRIDNGSGGNYQGP